MLTIRITKCILVTFATRRKPSLLHVHNARKRCAKIVKKTGEEGTTTHSLVRIVDASYIFLNGRLALVARFTAFLIY